VRTLVCIMRRACVTCNRMDFEVGVIMPFYRAKGKTYIVRLMGGLLYKA
jgi:hypothetical protein